MKNAANQSKKNSALPAAIITVLIAISLLAVFFSYNYLPETLATHWGLNGEANGYMPKLPALLLFPGIMLTLGIFFYIIPKIDPLKRNIEEFKGKYYYLAAIITGFLLYIQMIVITLNLGYNINIGQALSPAFAVLFFGAGIVLKNAKQNYFIGIRTPWTLNSEKNWNKTHKFGAKVFKAAGIVCLAGLLIPEYAFEIVLGACLAAAIASVIYSYKEFRKEKK